MSTTNDGGPAFPGSVRIELGGDRWDWEPCSGMSLRDWLAGQALPAVIAATCAGQHSPRHDHPRLLGIAYDAYELADAMLAARKQS